MKIKTLFLAALFVGGAAVAFAGKEDPRRTGLAVIPVKGSETYKVVYRGEVAGKVKLHVYNASGAVVLSQSINGYDGFILPLNFAGLASGEYSVEVTDGVAKKTEKVLYQANKNIKSIHVAKLNGESKYLLSIANGGNEVISLRIYDATENLIYSEETAIRGDFAQLFNLSKVASGFRFEITDKSGTTKSIRF
jgi:hypothetical protein